MEHKKQRILLHCLVRSIEEELCFDSKLTFPLIWYLDIWWWCQYFLWWALSTYALDGVSSNSPALFFGKWKGDSESGKKRCLPCFRSRQICISSTGSNTGSICSQWIDEPVVKLGAQGRPQPLGSVPALSNHNIFSGEGAVGHPHSGL